MRKTEPNQILDGRYRLIRVIGRGTFGTVWCAEHLALSALVALKVLETLSLAGEVRQRFMREAQAAASLRSPHVVQVLDCGMDGETPYIVMELLEGESLEQRLARVGCLGLLETERLIRHVARAVDRAHEAGIIHRDLKPGNVFIQANDGDELAKVLDFGIAKLERVTVDRSSAGLTPSGVLLGTPHYMSPEQIRGEQELDGRTDIWSLGVIAYECLLGRAPFDAESVTALLAAIIDESQPVPSTVGPVPAGFDEWFARVCAPDPAQRYPTAKQAAEALAALCAEGGALSGGAPDTLAARPVVAGATLPRRAAAPVEKENESTSREALPSRRRTSSKGRAGAALLLIAGAAGLWVINVIRCHPGSARSPGGASDPVEVSAGAQLAVEHPNAMLPGAAVTASPEPLARPAPARAPSANALSRRTHRPGRTATVERRATQLGRECDPPWYFDERGRPRAKPACL